MNEYGQIGTVGDLRERLEGLPPDMPFAVELQGNSLDYQLCIYRNAFTDAPRQVCIEIGED